RAACARARESRAPAGTGRPRRRAPRLRGCDPYRAYADRAGPRGDLVARACERDRPLHAHWARRAAAGRPSRLRGASRRPAVGEGAHALRRIAFSNLAAPRWTLERTLAAVAEYGYDGPELRLL